MRKTMSALLLGISLMGFVSCETTTTTGYYYPGTYYRCYDYYDYYYGYWYTDCGYYYYNEDGGYTHELDISGEVADREKLELKKTAEIYAEKFSLSNDQAMKIAKNVQNYQALQDRSAEDIADFAQKLYGVNPSEIASAVANAQVGNNAQMESVISKAAKNFNTNEETMKAIVKELHGKALEANGIQTLITQFSI